MKKLKRNVLFQIQRSVYTKHTLYNIYKEHTDVAPNFARPYRSGAVIGTESILAERKPPAWRSEYVSDLIRPLDKL